MAKKIWRVEERDTTGFEGFLGHMKKFELSKDNIEKFKTEIFKQCGELAKELKVDSDSLTDVLETGLAVNATGYISWLSQILKDNPSKYVETYRQKADWLVDIFEKMREMEQEKDKTKESDTPAVIEEPSTSTPAKTAAKRTTKPKDQAKEKEETGTKKTGTRARRKTAAGLGSEGSAQLAVLKQELKDFEHGVAEMQKGIAIERKRISKEIENLERQGGKGKEAKDDDDEIGDEGTMDPPTEPKETSDDVTIPKETLKELLARYYKEQTPQQRVYAKEWVDKNTAKFGPGFVNTYYEMVEEQQKEMAKELDDAARGKDKDKTKDEPIDSMGNLKTMFAKLNNNKGDYTNEILKTYGIESYDSAVSELKKAINSNDKELTEEQKKLLESLDRAIKEVEGKTEDKDRPPVDANAELDKAEALLKIELAHANKTLEDFNDKHPAKFAPSAKAFVQELEAMQKRVANEREFIKKGKSKHTLGEVLNWLSDERKKCIEKLPKGFEHLRQDQDDKHAEFLLTEGSNGKQFIDVVAGAKGWDEKTADMYKRPNADNYRDSARERIIFDVAGVCDKYNKHHETERNKSFGQWVYDCGKALLFTPTDIYEQLGKKQEQAAGSGKEFLGGITNKQYFKDEK